MWHSRRGGVLSRAVFAGSERGQVAAVVVRTIEVSPEGLIRDLGSRVIVSEAVPRVLVLCERAEELMRSDSSWRALEPGRLALELIRAAVATPGAGRPKSSVSVVRVGRDGVSWLNRGACSEEAVTAKSGSCPRCPTTRISVPKLPRGRQ
jgi:hypothetical protein